MHDRYGLGPGCYAVPRVGESIGSKHKERVKLVKADQMNVNNHKSP